MSITLTDRSRIEVECKRQRFLEYHALGTGIRQSRLSIPLFTGTHTHRGVENILKGVDIDKAVEIAISEAKAEALAKEFIVEDKDNTPDNQLFIFNEQIALIEALIRIYRLIQYPKILNEYEILAVEQEIDMPLVINDIDFDPTNPINIVLMSRADAKFRDKATEGLVVYSLKTSSMWTETNRKQSMYDVQGISEAIAIEYLDKEEVDAIKMDHLIKGQRKLLKEGVIKRYMQNTFLVHPFGFDTGFTTEYNLGYTKAKGWYRRNIWEEQTIKDWVDFLYTNAPEKLIGSLDDEDEGNKVIVSPYPYNRSLEDIQNWKESVAYQELEIAKHLQELRDILGTNVLVGPRETNNAEYKRKLNEYFPQDRKQCFQYGGFCPFVDVCWKGLQTTSLEYENRIPHHELEVKEFSV